MHSQLSTDIWVHCNGEIHHITKDYSLCTFSQGHFLLCPSKDVATTVHETTSRDTATDIADCTASCIPSLEDEVLAPTHRNEFYHALQTEQ